MPTDSFAAPVFVTGIPGRALTATARLLQDHCWTGTADGDPIDLQFQGGSSNAAIRGGIIDELLEKMAISAYQPRTFKGNLDRFFVRGMRNWVADVLRPMAYAGQRWMYADPHLALLFPTFAAAFPEARWVVIRQVLQHSLNELEQLNPAPARSREDWLDYCGYLLHWLDGVRAGVSRHHEVRADSEGNISQQSAMLLTNSLGISAQYAFSVSLDASGTGAIIDPGIETAAAGAAARPGRCALRHIRHYLTDRPLEIADDVALVGSSDQLRGAGLGPTIDAHQTIFRFNMVPVTAEFANDAGSRCDYYFLRKRMKLMLDAAAPDQRIIFIRQIQSSGVICYPGEFDLLRQFNPNPCQFEMSPQELGRLFRALLGDAGDVFSLSIIPRNGIRLLACLLAEGLRPSLYGFDLDARDRASHYFDDKEQVEMAHGHRPGVEYRLLQQLRERGLIRVV